MCLCFNNNYQFIFFVSFNVLDDILGGVFVTWRQKDPKEPELGLYGKQLNRSKLEECNDIYLVGMSNENDSIGDLKKKRPNIAFNKTKLNILWTNEGSKSIVSNVQYFCVRKIKKIKKKKSQQT